MINVIWELICCLASGMYVGLIAFWNALGIKNAIETVQQQIIAAGLGVPLVVVTTLATVIPIARAILKKVL